MTRLVVIGVVVCVGAAIGIAYGLGALAMFAFFAAIAAAVTYAAGIGGDWLQGASRRRFDDGRSRS
jgi:hypothetical protein